MMPQELSVHCGHPLIAITLLCFFTFNSTFISVKFKRLQVYCGRHHLSLCIILALKCHLGLWQRLQCLYKFLSVKWVIPIHHHTRQIEADFSHIAAVLGRFAPIAVFHLSETRTKVAVVTIVVAATFGKLLQSVVLPLLQWFINSKHTRQRCFFQVSKR